MTETIAELKFKLMQADTLIESRDEEVKALALEVTQLREALTQANELYNAVEAMNLELTERIAQDELAFGFMREANTLLTADVKRLTAELEQCKHALDDEGEMCECGRPLDEHEKDGLHPCTESGCLMFWLAEAK